MSRIAYTVERFSAAHMDIIQRGVTRKTETWVEIPVPALEPGDPGPLPLEWVEPDPWTGYAKRRTPSLIREDRWRDGHPVPRWWRRVR